MLAAQSEGMSPTERLLDAKNQITGKYIGRALSSGNSSESKRALELYRSSIAQNESFEKFKKIG